MKTTVVQLRDLRFGIKTAAQFSVSSSFRRRRRLLVQDPRENCMSKTCACRSRGKSDMMVEKVSGLLFLGFPFLTRVAEYAIPLIP